MKIISTYPLTVYIGRRVQLYLNFGPYELSISNSARWPWSYMSFRRPGWRARFGQSSWMYSFIWGAISIHLTRPGLDTIEVCDGCSDEVHVAGEDGISVCEGCGIVEGHTHHITLREYEAIHG